MTEDPICQPITMNPEWKLYRCLGEKDWEGCGYVFIVNLNSCPANRVVYCPHCDGPVEEIQLRPKDKKEKEV